MNTVTRLQCVFSCRNSLLTRAQLITSAQNNFHVSAVSRLKEIIREENEGTIKIKGVNVPSPREGKLLKLPYTRNSGTCLDCPLCKLGPTIHVKHTDVLILKQFVGSDGRLLPRSVTGLCFPQHKVMRYLVVMARHAGLLPKYLPDGTIDPTESKGWRANNKYYNEDAIDDMIHRHRRKV